MRFRRAQLYRAPSASATSYSSASRIFEASSRRASMSSALKSSFTSLYSGLPKSALQFNEPLLMADAILSATFAPPSFRNSLRTSFFSGSVFSALSEDVSVFLFLYGALLTRIDRSCGSFIMPSIFSSSQKNLSTASRSSVMSSSRLSPDTPLLRKCPGCLMIERQARNRRRGSWTSPFRHAWRRWYTVGYRLKKSLSVKSESLKRMYFDVSSSSLSSRRSELFSSLLKKNGSILSIAGRNISFTRSTRIFFLTRFLLLQRASRLALQSSGIGKMNELKCAVSDR